MRARAAAERERRKEKRFQIAFVNSYAKDSRKQGAKLILPRLLEIDVRSTYVHIYGCG